MPGSAPILSTRKEFEKAGQKSGPPKARGVLARGWRGAPRKALNQGASAGKKPIRRYKSSQQHKAIYLAPKTASRHRPAFRQNAASSRPRFFVAASIT
jgi:hypothetical protein